MTTPNMLPVNGWLILRGVPGHSTYSEGPYAGQTRIAEARIVGTRSGKPSIKPDEIAVRLSLRIHATQFLEGRVRVNAMVPAVEPPESIEAEVEVVFPEPRPLDESVEGAQ